MGDHSLLARGICFGCQSSEMQLHILAGIIVRKEDSLHV
jgi:hypothetical protein